MASNPKDGYAYTPIELTAIWNIPVTVGDLSYGRLRRLEFFRFTSENGKPDDDEIRETIRVASVGDVDALLFPDHETERVGEVSPPEEEPEVKILVADEHEAEMLEDGWVHQEDMPKDWVDTEDRPASKDVDA